jgi:hypothetical protein
MALPKIDVPTFEMTIPSTNKKVKYRPFLVKEEKVLLMALEGKDRKEMANALRQIINNCCMDDINVDELAPFDLEYFFLQLRAKSIGESLTLTYSCQSKKGKKNCENAIDFTVDVDKIKVTKNPDHTKQVGITDKIGIIMKYPELEDIMEGEIKEIDDNDVDEVLNLVIACMESIYDENAVYKMKDTDKEETKKFLEDLTQSQFLEIKKFFDTMPKVKYETTLVCNKCEGKNKVEIEGMQNFFG